MPNFSETLRRAWQECPDQVALTVLLAGQEDRPVTYSELITGASAWERTLKRERILPGEVVILILQHGMDLIYAYWGCVLHGAIPSIMPFLTEKLLPERYRTDLASLVGITKPEALITYREFEPEVSAALDSLAASGTASSVRRVIVSDEVESAGEVDFDSFLGLRRAPEDIVLLQHSSGTTGLQKGVALSHQAVFNQLESYARSLHLTGGDIIVSWLPLYHDMGLIAGFLMPILRRVPLVLLSPFEWVRSPVRLLQAVTKYKGTLSWLPNFAYNFCAKKIRERDLEGIDLSTWRAVSNCSEPTRYESHQLFLKRFEPYGLKASALCTCYAMAENVFAVTQGGIDSPLVLDEIDRGGMQVERVARKAVEGQPSVVMVSAGPPIPNVRVKVTDEHGKSLPDRVIGELALQSDSMLSGYYHREDATHKAIKGGWYFTGDYGYMVGEEVFVAGRKKDMIIVGGKNVYPMDLEELAMEVAGVHPGRVVAFGIFNEEAGTEDVVIVAEVETQDQHELERISDGVRQVVTRGSAIALRHVHLVGPKWLIKTSSGKTARGANKEKYLKETGIM